MAKIPLDPDELDKVNYIIAAWSRPCEAPWYMYVEAFKPAALAAFITLITFGWDDVARGYFRPRGLNMRRTGKRKGKWRRRIPRFPELGELIGENIPGADEQKGKQWNAAGKALWRIDTVLQQGLFWWLVADVTLDFAFDFTSVLYDSYWCRDQDLGRFSARKTNIGTAPAGFGFRASTNVMDYIHPPPTWTHAQGTAGSRSVAVAAAFDFKAFTPGLLPTGFSVRIREELSGKIIAENTNAPARPDGTLSVPVSGEIGPGVTFIVEIKAEGFTGRYFDGVVMGSEVAD